MEDNTGSRESKKKSMEDNTRSSESKEKRRKSMAHNTRSSESKEKSMEDNTRLTFFPCAQIGPSSARSFFRKARPRNHVKPGENIVLVRPKPSRRGNPKAPMEGDEEIIEEWAICDFCNDILREENILKTECECGNGLIHEKCVADWSRTGGNNCYRCGQEFQTFPVTLVRGLSSSTPVIEKKAKKKAKNV